MKHRTLTLFAAATLGAVTLVPAPAIASPPRAGAAGMALSLSPRADVQRFALVIGNNTTLDRKQSPLKYADDDAGRVAELLLEVGADVELVTAFDKESQELHTGLVAGATRPTKAGLKEAWQKLVRRMEATKEEGKRVELLIYYSGHGDVGPDGQGFLTLDGSKLTRQDLFGKLLEESPAEHNHILIDACQSEEFVLSRGKNYKPDRSRKDYGRQVAEYLDRRHLGAYPNTGVVLASSVDQQTHEWERYRGGIFTHELLSGLRGGADLNGDGSVEYSELGAFVSAANRGVGDPRARLEVTVRPPKSDERSPIVVHQDVARQRVLLFAKSDDARYTVEDRRGVRLADLNRSGERPGYLRLPPGPVFVYREPRATKTDGEGGSKVQEAKIGEDDGGILLASRLEFGASTRTARGSLDEAFRDGLFAIPYGPSYYAGYTDNAQLLGLAQPEWQVEVWEENEEGELEKVATTTTDKEPEIVTDDADGQVTVIIHEDEEEWDIDDTWGSLSFGTVMLPFTPEGNFVGQTQRLSANQFNGFTDDGFGRYFRGFDTRWYVFGADDYKDYPRVDGFMRLGYEQGQLTFSPPEGTDPVAGDLTRASYQSVPIFLGGNLYAFRRFPIRPYAGAGFGFDVVRLRYEKFERANDFEDLTARIGFELHAGIDVRLTNFASITAEIRQLWSARKKYDDNPHFRNTGAAAILGIRVGFPLGQKARRHRGGTTRVEIIEEKKGTAPKQKAPPKADDTKTLGFADAGNCPTGHCEITCGDDCKSECIGGDCTQTCEAGNTCNFACLGGDCDQVCKPGSKCELSCLGEDCEQSCEGAAMCKR